MKKTWPLFLLVLLFACNSGHQNSAQVDITFSDPVEQTVFLRELNIKIVLGIDSSDARNGKTSFKLNPAEAGLYVLDFGSDKFIPLVIAPGDKISIQGKNPENCKIVGSSGSENIRQFESRYKTHKTHIDSMFENARSKNLQNVPADDRKQIVQAYERAFKNLKDFTIKTIESDPGNLAAVYMLNQKFVNEKLFSFEKDLPYFKLVDSALALSQPGNKHQIDHHGRILKAEQKKRESEKAEKKLAIGKTIPNIILADSNGTEIPLHSLKGKKTLLYFWSAQDALSRKTNQLLTKIYNKKDSRDFEIYAISLDNNKKLWQGAIRLDQMKWINVSDHKGAASPVFKLFNLSGKLPYFILIDEQGKITHKGHDQKRIEELLLK
jgi:peroxiredoxin